MIKYFILAFILYIIALAYSLNKAEEINENFENF